MNLLDDPYGVNQEEYMTKGNDWIKANYPKINFITSVSITTNCPY